MRKSKLQNKASQLSHNGELRVKQKSHSIESAQWLQSKQHLDEADVDKENYYHSTSSRVRSRPGTDKSKSLSAGRKLSHQARSKRPIKNDLSLSSFSQDSHNKRADNNGPLHTANQKKYFMDGERMLKLLSPGSSAHCRPQKQTSPQKAHTSKN